MVPDSENRQPQPCQVSLFEYYHLALMPMPLSLSLSLDTMDRPYAKFLLPPRLALRRISLTITWASTKSGRKVVAFTRKPTKGQQSSTWCLADYALSTVERTTPWTSRLSGNDLAAEMLGHCYMNTARVNQPIE